MRTFKGFVQYGNKLGSMYEENGQTYVEPISSFSDANSVIDLQQQQQNTQQSGMNFNPNMINQFMQSGSSAGTGASSGAGSSAGWSSIGEAAPSQWTSIGSYGATPIGQSTAGASQAGASSGAGAGGGIGAMGMGAIILAAIAAQHGMSNNTDREFEGVKTDDAFAGHFGTEPWQAFMYDKLGINAPSAGEKFDAAVENGDWASALKRSPAMMNYWANPGGSIAYDLTKDKLGNWAIMADPASWLFDKLGG